MFRTGNGQLNGNKEMEQQVRPTLISNKVTFGLKRAKKTKFRKHSISTYCNTVGNFILAFFQFRSQPTVAANMATQFEQNNLIMLNGCLLG